MSPTKLTLRELHKQGVICQVVEKWNPFAKIRQDLFTFIDIVAISPGKIEGIQCTSASNHSARKKKILACPLASEWILAGGQISIWSWKLVKKGKRKVWECRIEKIL